MRYQFTGTSPETFPTIVTATGSLVLEPGAVVALDTDPDHPRLVPVKGKATDDDIAGWPAYVEPAPEPVEAPVEDPITQEG